MAKGTITVNLDVKAMTTILQEKEEDDLCEEDADEAANAVMGLEQVRRLFYGTPHAEEISKLIGVFDEVRTTIRNKFE